MKTLLILTGPQGAGNHLFAKLFSAHSAVYGWKSLLLDQYWLAHEHEPFARYWEEPERLNEFDWSQSDYFVTSISCPFARSSGETFVPDYGRFIDTVDALGIRVKVVIIGRDINILKFQQTRVRKEITLDHFIQQLSVLGIYDPIFVSQELIYLYGVEYLKSLSRQLNFPVDTDVDTFNSIVTHDTNAKYFSAAPPQYLDLIVQKVSGITHNK